MPRVWPGPDPVSTGDPDDYEIGVEQRANVLITLTRLWVYGDGTNVPGRIGRIWNPATGDMLSVAALPNIIPIGWSGYDLLFPVVRTPGQRWVVSFHTGGNYAAIAAALNVDVPSLDGAATTLSTGNATNGNGVFNVTPGVFPTNTFNATFYGVDVEYVLGTPGGTAPTITATTVVASDLTVTATITATDPDGLAGATYTVDWGDGAITSNATNVLAHLYAAAGTKTLLVSVTDSTGLSGFDAACITISAPPVPPVTVFDPVVMPLAREMLTCLDQEIEKVETPPTYVQLRPGTVVDHLLSTTQDECCEGLAWVRPASFHPSSGVFPTPDETPIPKGTSAWAVTLELGAVRCAPTPEATTIPTGAQWDNVTQAVMDDAAAMRRAICCFIDAKAGRLRRVVIGTWQPISVEGGCVGGTLPVTIMGPACDCSESGPES